MGETCNCVEEVAARYVDIITRRLRLAHYNILGHSFSALIAHRMVEVLTAQGVGSTLFLGDFEVAYTPQQFVEDYAPEKYTDRVKMGEWEGPELEAYKLAVRRHMYSHREDFDYCEQLL